MNKLLQTERNFAKNILKLISTLETEMGDIYKKSSKIPLNLVEALALARKEYNMSITRQVKFNKI